MDADILNTIRTRPRFVYESNLKKEEYLKLLKSYFEHKNQKIKGYVTNELAYFYMNAGKDSIWNPTLQLRVEDDEDGKTYVRGVFGPKPEIWTLFSFVYFGSIVLGILSFCFYFASLSFNPISFLLYLSLFFGGIVLALFIVSKSGQLATKDQMRLLKTFILMVIKDDYHKSNRLDKQF